MIVIDSGIQLTKLIREKKDGGANIGFVPTMGALHDGHISLVVEAINNNEIAIVSIFVNPIQFNNPDDLKKYPRTIENDLLLLGNHLREKDIVFTPSEKEIYPEKVNTKYNFGHLEQVMEGKFRKGHFNGVAIVVKKLFDITLPDKAYFGLKDFQQYIIIKNLVLISRLSVEIVACPINREADGLAMSSRNRRLDNNHRKSASKIYKALKIAKSLVNSKSIEEIRSEVAEIINSDPFLKLEYFEIVNMENLLSISNIDSVSGVIACIAVQAGQVRLIDNIIIK
ncbi:pantoate--beta-alanine ligase [Bacteroidota bacterium]